MKMEKYCLSFSAACSHTITCLFYVWEALCFTKTNQLSFFYPFSFSPQINRTAFHVIKRENKWPKRMTEKLVYLEISHVRKKKKIHTHALSGVRRESGQGRQAPIRVRLNTVSNSLCNWFLSILQL